MSGSGELKRKGKEKIKGKNKNEKGLCSDWFAVKWKKNDFEFHQKKENIINKWKKLF